MVTFIDELRWLHSTVPLPARCHGLTQNLRHLPHAQRDLFASKLVVSTCEHAEGEAAMDPSLQPEFVVHRPLRLSALTDDLLWPVMWMLVQFELNGWI